MKKVIVTFHGEYDFNNKYDYYSLKFASCCILLNEISFRKAKKFRADSIFLIGAFIPPIVKNKTSLNCDSLFEIDKVRSFNSYVFCTNAWDVAFDNKGNEIYGGSILIDIFKKYKNVSLVFSDPQGNYLKYLLSKYKEIPKNVCFITYNHDFIDVINICDAFIRATTTDGDSLSVHEALFFGKNVIASSVVDRPKGCILYDTQFDLENIITNFDKYKDSYKEYEKIDNIEKLKKLYCNQ